MSLHFDKLAGGISLVTYIIIMIGLDTIARTPQNWYTQISMAIIWSIIWGFVVGTILHEDRD